MDESIFKNYKEKQRYYEEKYKNRGQVIHVSKMIGKNGKVIQQGETYHSEKGEVRAMKRRAKQEH